MSRLGRTLAGGIVIAILALAGMGFTMRASYSQVTLEVCDLMQDNYYRQDVELQDWLEQCREQAQSWSLFTGKSFWIEQMNMLLEPFGVSHLFVFKPEENRALWENTGLDTGLRARVIEGATLISEVVPHSPGFRSGVEVGDEVLTIEGQPLENTYDVQTQSGVFELRNAKLEVRRVSIHAESLQLNLSPQIVPLGQGIGLLRLPSFLPQYFNRAEWEQVAEEILDYSYLIVDLRGNSGGSFPAMLRALSVFFCEPTWIGSLSRHRLPPLGHKANLLDDLSPQEQLSLLDEADELRLQTFMGYPCFSNPVVTLVDSGTSSVAEIFAAGIHLRSQSWVAGTPTAGQVVMAQWFPLTLLGSTEYSLSVPIAEYLTQKGEPIEDEGIYPQQLLHYRLEESRRGQDSWINEARLHLQAKPWARRQNK